MNTIAPLLLILALTYGTLADDTADIKSLAVPVPPIVTVTGVEYAEDPGTVPVMLNELPGVNVGLVFKQVIIVAPDANLSKICIAKVSGKVWPGFNLPIVDPTGIFAPPPLGSNAKIASASLA